MRELAAILLLSLPLAVRAQDSASAEIRSAYQAQRWVEVVRLGETAPSSPDVFYFRAVALARLERWADAARVLGEAQARYPRDARFLREAAGVALRQGQRRQARRFARAALRLDPADPYTHEVLATVFFLDGNTDAAVKHWNRAGKPRIQEVSASPPPRLDPILLDRAFAFSPAGTLAWDQLRESRRRVALLGVFGAPTFHLDPRPDGAFDLRFTAAERNGFGPNRWLALLNVFRGLPYQAVHPEYFNVGGRALNLRSMLRWDARKRRASLAVTSPLGDRADWGWELFADGRNESWDFTRTWQAGGIVPGMILKRAAAGAALRNVVNGSFEWGSGLELSVRDFRAADFPADWPAELVREGYAIKSRTAASLEILNLPERRLAARATANLQFGRVLTGAAGGFVRGQAGMGARWFPQASGEDYETTLELRGGAAGGDLPFDELFILGIERDNDLPLRAHKGTHAGRKGAAPLGRRFLLLNTQTEKIVWRAGPARVRLGPFLDVGRVFDRQLRLAPQQWLVDAGGLLRVEAMGLAVVLTYGKDLRTGRNVVYASVGR